MMPGRRRTFPLLIHVPDETVSFGWFLGAPIDEGENPLSGGLEVAEAGPDRPLQVRDGVEQPVVGGAAAQLLPEALDHVEARAVARQPVQLEVRAFRQGLPDQR